MTTTTDALTDHLRSALLDPDPYDLAARFYGPAWQADRFLRRLNGPPYWKSARNPHAPVLATLLRPALEGILAHDGRSVRETTATGWWEHTATGWHPTTPARAAVIVAEALAEVLTDALAIAEHHTETERYVEAERRDRLAALVDGPSHHREAVRAEVVEARERAAETDVANHLRVAVISAIYNVPAEASRKWSSVLQHLAPARRDTVAPLALPIDAISDVAVDWLRERLDDGDIVVGDSGWLYISSVRDAYNERDRDRDDVLPRNLLYRGLDHALGPRHRREKWRLPDDV